MTVARVYYANFENVSMGASASNIWTLDIATSNRAFVLHGFSITSDYTTDERARLSLIRYTAASTGGTTVVPSEANSGNALASLCTFRHEPTNANYGEELASWRWSQQGELLYLPTPEMRPVVQATSGIGIRLLAALGADRAWSGWVCWEEL